MTEVITIVTDKNPNMDDAVEVIRKFMPERVTGFGETTSMAEPALYAYVEKDSRAELVSLLNLAGFRILEGGQL